MASNRFVLEATSTTAEKDAAGGIRFLYIYCRLLNFSDLSGGYLLLKSYYVLSTEVDNLKLLIIWYCTLYIESFYFFIF